jgi:hypothetical protein
MAMPTRRQHIPSRRRDPAEVESGRTSKRGIDRLDKEQLRAMVHERWREDARCVIEILTKIVCLVLLVVGVTTGTANEVLDVVRAILSATD